MRREGNIHEKNRGIDGNNRCKNVIKCRNMVCKYVPPGMTPVPPAIPAAVFATRFP